MGIVIRERHNPFRDYMAMFSAATESEQDAICADECGIEEKFENSTAFSPDGEAFALKRNSHILARVRPEEAKRHKSREWSIPEKIYLSSIGD